ncbi:MAG: hypothetical protein EAY75_18135 [Bacteroidetes bacterium]|nr:MAG: hypothetical protein EAY75_18135 [Bacteroidota bacterium]
MASYQQLVSLKFTLVKNNYMTKLRFLSLYFVFCCLWCSAMAADSTRIFPVPDSVKGVVLVANIKVNTILGKRGVEAGIKTTQVSLTLEAEKGKRKIDFDFPENATVVATGVGVDASEAGELEWNYFWNTDSTYTLMLATASDSTHSLYSAFIWLPEKMGWKLIGTCKVVGASKGLSEPAYTEGYGKRSAIKTSIAEVWMQRANGSWKTLLNGTKTPVTNPMRNVDSLEIANLENAQIAAATAKLGAMQQIDGVYYQVVSPGTGRQVLLSDSVVVYYKGYLLNGEVFDQTKDKPATFPLSRLIKGWQLALPQTKVGGKTLCYIPSGQAYGIRLRAAKIPPNSVLVFEITVADAIAVK